MIPVLDNLYHWMQNIPLNNLLLKNYFVTTTVHENTFVFRVITEVRENLLKVR